MPIIVRCARKASVQETVMIANAQPSSAPAPAAPAEKSLLFLDDAQSWFETQRAFGAAEYGGALFGEVLATSVRIEARRL